MAADARDNRHRAASATAAAPELMARLRAGDVDPLLAPAEQTAPAVQKPVELNFRIRRARRDAHFLTRTRGRAHKWRHCRHSARTYRTYAHRGPGLRGGSRGKLGTAFA